MQECLNFDFKLNVRTMNTHKITCIKYAFFISIALSACQSATEKIKVSCVGDSITEGATIYSESTDGYPEVLNKLLGEDYTVQNAGRSGATLQKEGDFPYWHRKEFSNVIHDQPDIIVIKLGTNDTKPQNWNADRFKKDYQSLIDTFKTIPTHPEIYLCLPAPVFKTNWGINDSTVVNGVIPIISDLATSNNLTLIDLYQGLNDQSDNFPDGIHPNENGAKSMAEIIAKVIR